MKKLNLSGVFIVGMALVIGSSGCHRHPSGLTPIPGSEAVAQNNEVPPGAPVAPDGSVNSTPGAISENHGVWDNLFNGAHNENREKFQADTVYFDFDRATIKASEESKLQDVAS